LIQSESYKSDTYSSDTHIKSVRYNKK